MMYVLLTTTLTCFLKGPLFLCSYDLKYKSKDLKYKSFSTFCAKPKFFAL